MTPRAMAHAYLIHAYAEPLEWNVTIQDIADATGLANNRIGRILRDKGWFSRVRTSIMDYQGLSARDSLTHGYKRGAERINAGIISPIDRCKTKPGFFLRARWLA